MADASKEVARCPRDGQTRDYHLAIGGTHSDGRPRTNGEFMGCDFGTPERTSQEFDPQEQWTLAEALDDLTSERGVTLDDDRLDWLAIENRRATTTQTRLWDKAYEALREVPGLHG